jgi:hypothetical protein
VEAEGGEGERLPTRSGLSKHSRAGGPLWRGGGARERAVAAIERAWARVGLVGGGRVHTHTCGARGTVQVHRGRQWGDCHGVSQPSQSVRGAVGDGRCTVVHAAIERAGARVASWEAGACTHTHLWCTGGGARAPWAAVGDRHGVTLPSHSVRGAVGDGWCTVVHAHGVHREVERWPEAVGDGRTVGGR